MKTLPRVPRLSRCNRIAKGAIVVFGSLLLGAAFAAGNPLLEMLPGARAMGLGGVILTSDAGADAFGDNPASLFSRQNVEGLVNVRLVEGELYNLVNFSFSWQPAGGIAVGVHCSSLGVPDFSRNDAAGASLPSQNLSQTTFSAGLAGRLLLAKGGSVQAGAALHVGLSSDNSLLPQQPAQMDLGVAATLASRTRFTATVVGFPLVTPDATTFQNAPIDFRAGVAQLFEAPKLLNSALEISAKFLSAETAPILSAEISVLGRLITLRGATEFLIPSMRFVFFTGAGLGVEIGKGGLRFDLDYGLRVFDRDLTHLLGARAGVAY